MIGTTLLNRYQIESELGKGGMGIVYKAHDTLLHRAVAIKFLNTSGVGTEGKSRLLQEARAAARLNHPNIVSVYDAGEADDSAFIVMELVKGDTLRIAEKSNVHDALRMAQQICLALDHAHSNGIIHRDLKLENIVITNTQTLKLMDFGLARTADDVRMTEEGMLTGTLAYLAPELIQGDPASVQSDLYAFGIILYELLIGSPPFQGTINTVLAQHMQGKVTPPSEIDSLIPAWVDELILRLLSKRPEERPASAKDVLLVLEQKSVSSVSTSFFSIPSKSKNNLPVQLTSFIGREKEIEEVIEAIKNHRLVTLTGSGGTGKTRLSLQVAEDLLDHFEQGVWFIELAPLADPDLIPQTVLSVIGISEQAGKAPLEVLKEYLQAKKSLIVLDNCEHLIEASAKISNALLGALPELKVLASSREALGIKGEMSYHVPSLSLPDPKHLPAIEQLSQYEAVRLFIDRALLVAQGFVVDNDNASFIVRICHRLDGIPLAIELAAARIKMMSVEQISARLDDRFRLLTGGARTALPRQQTLRALIDWSYNLLTEPERALLRHLTVFSGGWTLEAAESVCSEDGSGFDILDLLTQLVDKSLVNLKDSRYRILETTRQYAREKLLDSGEGASVHNKHLHYFLDLAEKADKEIHGPDQVDWINKIESEYDNFLAALGWCVSEKNTEIAIRLLIAVEWDWRLRGHYYETRTWFNAILSLPDISEYPAIYARLLVRVGRTSWLIGAHQDARAYLEESQSICLKLGDESEQDLAEALDFLGFIDEPVEDYNKKEILYKQSLELYQKWGNKRGMAEVIYHLGMLETNRNNAALSLSLFEQSLGLFQQLGDLWGMSRVYENTGWLYLNQEDYKKAKTYFDQQLFIDEKLQFRHGHFNALNSLGNFYRHQGNYHSAEIYYKKSIVLARGYGINWESLAYYHLGMLALHQNDYPLAVNRFAQLFEMDRKIYEKASACDLLVASAAIAGGTNQPERSAKLYGAAQTIFDTIDYRISALDQREFDRHIQTARDQLGESAFDEFANEGRGLTIEQAIAYALETSA